MRICQRIEVEKGDQLINGHIFDLQKLKLERKYAKLIS